MKSLSSYRPYTHLFVDAMNLVARSYHGMPMLEYKGKKTGTLMGVSRLVIDWRKRNNGIHIVFVWEGVDSWRKEKHPIYKAHRKSDPGEDRDQFFESVDLVRSSLPVMGVDQVSARTYEADDTVWTASELVKGKLLFCSTDWDWWSLADRGDILYQNDVLTTASLESRFSKKFNCNPIPMGRMWMFKALTGDPSDNVSGVPRFPKKVASEIASDQSLGRGDIVHGLISHGHTVLADRVAQNYWIVERNLELVSPSPPPMDDLDWVMGEYDEYLFGEVLMKSGMGHLYDRLIGGDRGV